MVRENRAKNSADSIQLSFIRFKSTNPNPGNPIVYLSGGPGGSGSGTAKGRRFELFMKLREVADVIAYDQRGTGMSNRLPGCPYTAEVPVQKPLNKEDYLEITLSNIQRCKTFWDSENVDLEAYNTTENAKDLEVLRKVLKQDKISLWGISYGSHLAFEYLRLFEDHIDKMVLASLEGPDETLRLPTKTDAFLDQLCERAKENYGHTPKYPDLKNKVRAVHNRLKKEPLFVKVYDDNLQEEITVAITDFDLQLAVTAFYYRDPGNSSKLPKLYSQMFEGDFSEVAQNVAVLKRYISKPSEPMSFAMDMHSGATDHKLKRIKKEMQTTTLGHGINFLLPELLEHLDYFDLPDSFYKLKENNVKTLLLSGTMDGRTYLSSAVELAKSFKNGEHLIIDNAGHNLYMESPVIGDAVVRFFQGEELNLEQIVLKPVIFK
jgi:pimeloyl-ACP methyl ester carboxylesterase